MFSDESLKLETRQTTVNRELSLAREFIAAQSRDIPNACAVAKSWPCLLRLSPEAH